MSRKQTQETRYRGLFVDFGGRSNFISQVVKRNWYFHEWFI